MLGYLKHGVLKDAQAKLGGASNMGGLENL